MGGATTGTGTHNAACKWEADIADFKDLKTTIKSMAKAQSEMLLLVKDLADQDRRILAAEIANKQTQYEVENLYSRVRKIEATPMYFPEWKKGLILLVVGWAGCAGMIMVSLRWTGL